MDLKKTPRASLENKRFTNLIVGIIITLSLILISFEWTRPLNIKADLSAAREIDFDMEEMEVIPREEQRSESNIIYPPIDNVIDIVQDDIEIEEVDFSNEVTDETRYSFKFEGNDPREDIVEDPIPFPIVEDKPLFNGGDPQREFVKYIARNLVYPEIASINGVYGRVIVQFVIDESGNLVDPVVVKSVDPALDAEAIRVLNTSPAWIPGKQRSKPVRVSYTFPINFVLQ